jgi:hypothetical protein
MLFSIRRPDNLLIPCVEHHVDEIGTFVVRASTEGGAAQLIANFEG